MTNVLESAIVDFTAETGMHVEYDLKAAYMGTEWMGENLSENPSLHELPGIFLSAGFRLFFTDPRLIALRSQGAFADRSGWDGVNAFARENALCDPESKFTVIGVVPAMFMVNREQLGERRMPQSWEDVLSPEFENSLALPVGDFDLFDSLLIGIHRRFGMAGVERLAHSMFRQMHPAQMVASAGNQDESPAITVMPYFFTRTITESSPLVAVWPRDGALAAPILLVTRTDRLELQPLIDTIAGLPMSRVMSRMGLFPSTHPENDDFDGEEHPLQWPGWDALLSTDLPDLLAKTARAFEAIINERSAAGIPVQKGLSGSICPDHYFASNIEEAVSWGQRSTLEVLFTESAGLCNRCSPHIRGVTAVAVFDNLSGINSPRKVGPMLRTADIVVITKGDIVSQAEREVFASRVHKANPRAKIVPVNGLSGQGAFELARLIRDEGTEQDTVTGSRLRYPIPSAVCSYCLGEQRIGAAHQIGNVSQLDLTGARS